MHLVHVEDDRLESELVRATLENHSSTSGFYQETTVKGGVRLILGLTGPVAVLCDHQLPDGTARDLLDALHGRPDVRVVVMSGCITPSIAALRMHPRVLAVFEKPMGLDDLEGIVEAALTGTARAAGA